MGKILRLEGFWLSFSGERKDLAIREKKKKRMIPSFLWGKTNPFTSSSIKWDKYITNGLDVGGFFLRSILLMRSGKIQWQEKEKTILSGKVNPFPKPSKEKKVCQPRKGGFLRDYKVAARGERESPCRGERDIAISRFPCYRGGGEKKNLPLLHLRKMVSLFLERFNLKKKGGGVVEECGEKFFLAQIAGSEFFCVHQPD